MLTELETLLANYTVRESHTIAAELTDLGIRGVRGEPTCCPFARYLRQELDIPYASVETERITIVTEDGAMFDTATPSGVARFAKSFDDDWYPELIDNNGPTDEELATIAAEEAAEEQDLREHILV